MPRGQVGHASRCAALPPTRSSQTEGCVSRARRMVHGFASPNMTDAEFNRPTPCAPQNGSSKRNRLTGVIDQLRALVSVVSWKHRRVILGSGGGSMSMVFLWSCLSEFSAHLQRKTPRCQGQGGGSNFWSYDTDVSTTQRSRLLDPERSRACRWRWRRSHRATTFFFRDACGGAETEEVLLYECVFFSCGSQGTCQAFRKLPEVSLPQ